MFNANLKVKLKINTENTYTGRIIEVWKKMIKGEETARQAMDIERKKAYVSKEDMLNNRSQCFPWERKRKLRMNL